MRKEYFRYGPYLFKYCDDEDLYNEYNYVHPRIGSKYWKYSRKPLSKIKYYIFYALIISLITIVSIPWIIIYTTHEIINFIYEAVQITIDKLCDLIDF